MTFHNRLADRQADARARKFIAGVKAFKNAENMLVKLRLDPDAIVGDGKSPQTLFTAIFQPGGNMNARRVFATILNRVADQILEELLQMYGFHSHDRQGFIMRDESAALADRLLQNVERRLERFGRVLRDIQPRPSRNPHVCRRAGRVPAFPCAWRRF